MDTNSWARLEVGGRSEAKSTIYQLTQKLLEGTATIRNFSEVTVFLKIDPGHKHSDLDL